jgi:glycosyltransferase involved in cell wall biosynthesis
MKPLVSILIPAHNAERWIAETISSALGQTWPRKEIIVVDDGSRDETLRVAKRFESPCVKVIGQPNRGACAARNVAYACAQGDYIQWLDADDLLHAEKIAEQVACALADGDDRNIYAGAWAHFFRYPRRAHFLPNGLWQNLGSRDWLYEYCVSGKYLACHAYLIPRRLAERSGPWDEALLLNQDGEYICRVTAKSNLVRFVPGARCYYRRGVSSSISSKRSSKVLISLCQSVIQSINHYLALDDSPRAREACLRLMQRNIDAFRLEEEDVRAALDEKAVELGGRLGPPRLSGRKRLASAVLGRRLAEGFSRRVYSVELTLRMTWETVQAKLPGTAG